MVGPGARKSRKTLFSSFSHCFAFNNHMARGVARSTILQANEQSSGFQKGAYRDGVKREEKSQGWDCFMT